MKHWRVSVLGLNLALVLTIAGRGAAQGPAAVPDWALNATVIEACSCPLLCPSYFNSQPAAQEDSLGEAVHYCRFNSAYRVNKGHYGKTKLDGALFWLAGDRGADFTKGLDWAVLVFDKSLADEKRSAIAAMAGFLYPLPYQFRSVSLAEGKIEWASDAAGARASVDGGAGAEIKLVPAFADAAAPVLLQGVRYWGAPRNEGFALMRSELEAYRVGARPFESRGTSGFVTTVDLSSADAAAAAPAGE